MQISQFIARIFIVSDFTSDSASRPLFVMARSVMLLEVAFTPTMGSATKRTEQELMSREVISDVDKDERAVYDVERKRWG